MELHNGDEEGETEGGEGVAVFGVAQSDGRGATRDADGSGAAPSVARA
jgi:hypothetical protein